MMINKTNLAIPKKYVPMIDEVFEDHDGYWAYSKPGYRFEQTESHIAHDYTSKTVLMSYIRSLEVCDCDECEAHRNEREAAK